MLKFCFAGGGAFLRAIPLFFTKFKIPLLILLIEVVFGPVVRIRAQAVNPFAIMPYNETNDVGGVNVGPPTTSYVPYIYLDPYPGGILLVECTYVQYCYEYEDVEGSGPPTAWSYTLTASDLASLGSSVSLIEVDAEGAVAGTSYWNNFDGETTMTITNANGTVVQTIPAFNIYVSETPDPYWAGTFTVPPCPTSATISGTIGTSAPLGFGTGIDLQSLYLQPNGGNTAPTITSISPDTWIAGSVYSVTITGTNFIPSSVPTAGCAATPVSISTPSGAVIALSNVAVVSTTQITATIAPPATEPTELATVTVGTVPNTASAQVQIVAEPTIELQRIDLMDIQAAGTPAGGTFSSEAQPESGATNAGIDFAPDSSANANPSTFQLSDPDNPSSLGSPSPGGLENITITYATQGDSPSKAFEVPTFGISCYYTALQGDWGTAPNSCVPVKYKGTRYTGTTSNPPGLSGTYCDSFLFEVRMQGSATLDNGQEVQYNAKSKTYATVDSVSAADGTPPVANKTVARDRSIIPGKGILIDLDQVGTGLLANDTGSAIVGYRIDLYKGAGKAVCSGFKNVMAVGACTPATTGCPASTIN